MSNQDTAIAVREENVRTYINHVFIDYLLLPDRELKVLLALKSFAWSGNECYPSLNTIGQICGKKRSQLIEILNLLEAKQLIRKETNEGSVTIYYITNKPIVTEQLSVERVEPVRIPALPPSGDPDYPRPEIRTLSNIREKNKEKERARKKQRAPLTPFSPNEANRLYCKENGIDLDAEIESFKEVHTGKKTQFEFKRWIDKAIVYKNKPAKIQEKSINPNEPHSTVADWDSPFHPSWDNRQDNYRELESKRILLVREYHLPDHFSCIHSLATLEKIVKNLSLKKESSHGSETRSEARRDNTRGSGVCNAAKYLPH